MGKSSAIRERWWMSASGARWKRALRSQEEFQRYLLESFPDLIFVIDLNERYSFVSSRIRDLRDTSRRTWSGRKSKRKQDLSPEFLGSLPRPERGPENVRFCEYRRVTAMEVGARCELRPVRCSMRRTRLSGVIVSVRDITVEKKLEQQIIQSERLAAMGQMIGGFAHELNNPLTSILGMAELLQEGGSPESVRKQLVMLQQQSAPSRRNCAEPDVLLAAARPGKSPIDLSELVQRTLHLHAYSLRKSNITVDFLQRQILPPVSGDAHQLMQVFLNLMLNRNRQCAKCAITELCAFASNKDEKSVAVIFQDDGPGISPEILPNIFDPFYTTKRPGRGTGLGLSICKAILREHNGNVEAASGPGGGAVFTVTLPIASVTTPPEK